jgi:alanyl-tRNA synthetase
LHGFSRQIGIREPFLYRICDPIAQTMSAFYPDLTGSLKNVKSVIESEEKRFLETIENGMDRLDEIMKDLKKSGGGDIPGKDVFLLYDTFGFPVEMTREIALEQGLSVDMDAFEREMNVQRERGKQSWKGADQGLARHFEDAARQTGDTAFRGYELEKLSSTIEAIYDEKGAAGSLTEGSAGLVVLKETPFYGESGGQVGDRGILSAASGARFEVEDTRKLNRTIIHVGRVINGEFRKGDAVEAAIDVVNRNLIRANHSATHLLQAALRKTLGEHVRQAGSIVEPDRLRFDFSHFNAMSEDEIRQVENLVNARIWENLDVSTVEMDIQDAVAQGAMAVFDEKYEDRVRVVTMGGFSKELCGGTHVNNTGKIGVFKILREMSPGAGIRRIEATTLKGLLDLYREQERLLSSLMERLNIGERDLPKRIDDIIEKSRSLEKELERMKKETLGSGADDIIARAPDVKGIKLVSHIFEDMDANDLKKITDAIREKEQNSVVIFGSTFEGTVNLVFAATKPAVDRGIDCNALVKTGMVFVEGRGGGRKDMAQAGGKKAEGLKQAIGEALKLAEAAIS